MKFCSSVPITMVLATSTFAQSPGPDWPRCTKTSTSHHPGWEVLGLDFLPPDGRHESIAVRFEIQNAADGSRTTCDLSRDATEAETALDSIILDNDDGLCLTFWAANDDFEGATVAETAKVRFDVSSGELTVEQTWSCDDDAGTNRMRYTGKTTQGFDYECAVGREGEQTTCHPTTLFIVGEAPIFAGPAKVMGVSAGGGSSTSYPIDKQENCDALPTEFAGWQILSMSYWPPAEQPEGSPYEPVSLRIDVRNLNDGSRTVCYLKSDDISDADDGITLSNKGASLGDGNYDNGCATGWFDLASRGAIGGSDQVVSQEWKWYTSANVAFNTKTHELEISQTWPCGGVDNAFEAYVLQKLDLDCGSTGNSMVPSVCAPTDALYSASGSPVIVKGVLPGFLTAPGN